jgi:hypothetical protein
LTAAALLALALATAVAGGGPGAPVADCHGFAVPVAFGVAGERPARVVESLSTDSLAQSCTVESLQTVARGEAGEATPALGMHVLVEAHPAVYRPDAQAQRHLRDYRLAVAAQTHAMWPHAYTLSEPWSPPRAHLPWRCVSALATAELGAASGDESIVCAHADAERVVVVRAHVAREAAGLREAILANVAAIRPTGGTSAHSATSRRPP